MRNHVMFFMLFALTWPLNLSFNIDWCFKMLPHFWVASQTFLCLVVALLQGLLQKDLASTCFQPLRWPDSTPARGKVPYRGPIDETIRDLQGGVRSACTCAMGCELLEGEGLHKGVGWSSRWSLCWVRGMVDDIIFRYDIVCW